MRTLNINPSKNFSDHADHVDHVFKDFVVFRDILYFLSLLSILSYKFQNLILVSEDQIGQI